MEKRQNIFIKAKDSEYLHNIIQKNDWQSIIELASGRNAHKDLLYRFFQTDQSIKVLNGMSEEQIINLLDVSPLCLEESILARMELLCDSTPKFSSIASKLMKELYACGGDFNRSSIIKCLPINIIRIIIDSRIPKNKFCFGSNKQEFFMYIISALNSKSSESQNFHYRNLKESDCLNDIFIYIKEEADTFPVGRKEVFKEIIKSLKDAFIYIEGDDSISNNSNLIDQIIDPIFTLITKTLQNKIYDYKSDKEIIGLLTSIFGEFYYSKFFISKASAPILNGSGNYGLLQSSKILEKCQIITATFYYKVFKKAVELNRDNFVNQIAKSFFTSSSIFRFIRELDDGIYDKLFNAAITFSVKEIIERKRSDNLAFCIKLLSNNVNDEKCSLTNKFVPKFDECLHFINSVISQLLEKKDTLNADYSTFPEICCYILNLLNGIQCEGGCKATSDVLIRCQNRAIYYLINDINENVHRPINLIDPEMRNKLVLGVIQHPVDASKFSSIIASNNPTFLVKFICYFRSVSDVRLILPEEKRAKVDKYGFLDCKTDKNSNEPIKMSIVEVFLRLLRFWENNDKSLFRDGYIAYYQFVRKILMESILTNDNELKKAAISVYYRYSELIALMKNAKYLCFRIRLASLTFLTPLAVIVGSEIDENFVEKYIKKYVRSFNSQSYQFILSEILSRSHIDINYYEDEIIENGDDDDDDDLDRRFKRINIDQQYATAIKLLLELIKENPVKTFHLYYTTNLTDCFFISRKRFIQNLKEKFEILNPKIIDICNPLKTDYPLSMVFNSPQIDHAYLKQPQFKLSCFAFLEICRFIAKEFKEYSPLSFKSKHTKQLIKIQTFLKKLISNVCDTFRFGFTLDKPTIDTIQSSYFDQEKYTLNVIYTHSFFDFLNEINDNQKSIFNDESFEVIKNAMIARFLSEKEYLKQKNQPPPKFSGFNIIIEFKRHQESIKIFNEMNYRKMIEDYEFNTYQKVKNMNQKLIKQINQVYNISKLINDNPIDDVFDVDLSIHKNRQRSLTSKSPEYPMNVHKCFIKIMNALNKSKAENFVNDFECLERLNTFKPIKNCGSDSSQYSMLTHLLDLLINNFCMTKSDMYRSCKNCIVTYEDIYRYMTIVARIASPNIGYLKNLKFLCHLKETVITERVPQIGTKLFEYIFKCGNVDQILLCMNSYLFAPNASLIEKYLLKTSGLVYAKGIINEIINEIVNNEKQVLDVFHVALAKCSIYPRFVGFPIPSTNLEYLKLISATKSISSKRASCANAVYYSIMNFISGNEIPLNEILEIIECAHSKAPDEITAFFCLLISKEISLSKMNSLPALNDLMNENALPDSFILNQGPDLILLKEIGDLYYRCIEKVILSGLKSNKSHIYNLTVTVLNEINAGPEIQMIVRPFIEKGLSELKPNDDNEDFLKYATSFTMKNPEFKECFNSYCDALSAIKKHSFDLLKANTQFNENSPYPQSFKKLDFLYASIMDTIERPFIEFKDDSDMISISLFCRNLLPFLSQNRPAVSLDVFLRLEGCVSIFGDVLIEEIVQLNKSDNKDEALSKFIVLITHHDELLFSLPQSIVQMYNKLKSAFSIKHTILLSKNLASANFEFQRDYRLAALLSPDVLAHMPEEQPTEAEKVKGIEIENLNEDEIVEVISNLGIFCKKVYWAIPCPVANQKLPVSQTAAKVCSIPAKTSMKKGNSVKKPLKVNPCLGSAQSKKEKEIEIAAEGITEVAEEIVEAAEEVAKEITEVAEEDDDQGLEVTAEEIIEVDEEDDDQGLEGTADAENIVNSHHFENGNDFVNDIIEEAEDAGYVEDAEENPLQDKIKDAFDLFT